MFICHCRAVSDHTIRDAIAAGAADPVAVALACEAGARCGGCLPSICRLLAEAGFEVDPVPQPSSIRRAIRNRVDGPHSVRRNVDAW